MADFNYELNSESEEEEEEEEEEEDVEGALQGLPKVSQWTLDDINKLKEQTTSLLDSSWKETRNKNLIGKMLELEQPTITAKMVDFVLQDSVCEALVSVITQNGHEGERPGPNDQHGENMRMAYRAVVLLSPEIISDPLNLLLSKKVGVIARKLFDIFADDAAGSFYHAYRILECFLRCYPSETFNGLVEDGQLATRMTNMMKYVGFTPVCELVVMLIAFTPVVRNSQLCLSSAKSRWIFLDNVNSWNIMLHTVRAMVMPEQVCVCTDAVTADQHSTAASQLFQDLLEKLSLEDSGDLLFLPIGSSSEILDLLIFTMTDHNADPAIRRSAAKNVGFLLRRAAEPEIVCYVAANASAPPTPTFIPNRLHTLREKIVDFVRDRVELLVAAILRTGAETDSEPVKYSSYTVQQPFGVLRQMMVEVLVLTVESDESVASLISLELWMCLISWTLRYAHNNIYHALFYRLVFAVLRQGVEEPQRMLFQKAKFASFLVDNFVPYHLDESGTVLISEPIPKDTPNYDLLVRRIASRGLIMNCANAIRYQVSSEASNTFLFNFLNAHQKWNAFLPELTAATDVHMKFGMGIKIVVLEAKPGNNNSIQQLMSEAKPLEDTMDQNTRFAKSLGFFEEAPWSLETISRQCDRHEMEDESNLRLSYLANEEEHEPQPTPPSDN